MALTPEQIEDITVLVKKGGLSNRAIAKKLGCSESAVRTWIKKNGIEKNALKDLASAEIQNIIIADEIKTQKNALSDLEKTHYTEVLLEEARNKDLIISTSQRLMMKISDDIEKGVKLEKINIGDGMQNFEPVGHGSSDFKNFADAIDKVSVTMGVNERFAPKTEINNTNAQQNNNQDIVGYTVKTIE